ncbi:MAG: hypothetical protein KKB51_12725 [Candidatus Riflebacteria bacterium]|nr:hypothetical protein [Candidatus Riflebacteria bacterium]
MFATVILAVAILPIVGVFSQGHSLSQKDMRRIGAIHLAESTMNKLLKLPYSMVSIGTVNSDLVTASGTVPFGNINGEAHVVYAASLVVSDYPVTFSYHPVDLNDPGYDVSKSETWKFLPSTSDGATFNGSGPFKPIMVKQYEVSVSWTEPNGVTPPPINIVTLKANLEE